MKLGFLVTCSQYHLTMVAWERFVAVRKWMDYKVIVTKRRLIKIAIFRWLSAIFTRGCLYTLWGVTIADIEAKHIWIMITIKKCLCNDKRSLLSSFISTPWFTTEYANVGRAIRLCYTRRFATTIFCATRRCKMIVATLFRTVTTLFQHCNAVLR